MDDIDFENQYDNKGRIFFCKWDYWSNGKHWMSSASADIFDEIWYSIQNTFYHNLYKNNKEEVKALIEQILHLRRYQSTNLSTLFKMGKSSFKTLLDKEDNAHKALSHIDITLANYSPNKLSMDDFYQNYRQENLEINKVSPIIYKSFQDYYANANHGFSISGEAYPIVRQFWDVLVPEVNVQKLQEQYEKELQEMIYIFNEEKTFYKKWVEDGCDSNLFFFKLKKLKQKKSIS